MEKYFVINKDSQCYSDYFKWKEDVKKIIVVWKKFKKEHSIESESFVPGKKRLLIQPTKADLVNLKGCFNRTVSNGLRQFNARSRIAKDWIETVKNIDIPSKPHYFEYGIRLEGRSASRIFSINDVLYGSIDAESVVLLPFMVEIKASEFFKIIEDYEESQKQEESND